MRLNEHQNTPRDYARARRLRNDPSPFEQRLWVALREQAKAHGLKFRRQQAVHPFIADFACMEARLIVELDGDSHDARLGYDKIRDEKLHQMGFFVLRFTDMDAAESLDHIVNEIITHAAKLIDDKKRQIQLHSPLPNPPREGEGILFSAQEIL